MKKIFIVLAMAFATLGISAQEQPDINSLDDAQKAKEINNIKRSEDAIYIEELVEFAADDNENTVSAKQQRSMQLLQTHVLEVFAKRMNLPKEDVQEIWDVIEDKMQNVEVKKGDLVRVFTYVAKDAFSFLTGKKNKTKEIDEYFNNDKKKASTAVASATPVAVPTVAPVSVEPVLVENDDKADSVATQPIAEQQVVAEEKVDTLVAQVTTTVEPVVSEPIVAEEKVDTLVATTSEVPVVEEATKSDTTSVTSTPTTPSIPATPVVAAPVVTATPASAPVAEEVKVVIPELCQKLLDQKDMNKLLSYLDTEKAYENLIYGTYRAMRKVADCYIVILDKSSKKIITVLDKGVTDRMNFVTKQMDNYNNYRAAGSSYLAVFVQPLK